MPETLGLTTFFIISELFITDLERERLMIILFRETFKHSGIFSLNICAQVKANQKMSKLESEN